MSPKQQDPPGPTLEHPAQCAAERHALPITSRSITRRALFQIAAAPFAAAAMSRLLPAAAAGRGPLLGAHASSVLRSAANATDRPPAPESASWTTGPETGMGIASTSLTPVSGGAVASAVGRTAPGPVWDAFEFLEKCHQIGASGIQTEINGNLMKLNIRAKELGMWIEGMVSVPKNGDTAAFEQSLLQARAAGATVVRAAMLGGRRYESFSTLDDWKRWVDQAHQSLKVLVPILDRQKVTLAIENHKDWTLDEMQRLLRTYESEYLGVCFDFGNNIALLDDPMEMAAALAKYVRSTHVKDMGVRPYQDGFLLSEVPLGTGILDLPGIVSTLRRANPGLRLSLEMITRDPLKVPCLSPHYWTVFPDRNGKYLAKTLRMVEDHSSGSPLPTVSNLGRDERIRVEEENVKACLRYAYDKLQP